MKKTLKNNKKKPLIPLFSKILLALAAISLAIFVIAKKNAASAELVMPISALKLGTGEGKATLQWTESIDSKTLYFNFKNREIKLHL